MPTAQKIAENFDMSIRWLTGKKRTTSNPDGEQMKNVGFTLRPKLHKSEAPPGHVQPITQNSIPYGGLKFKFEKGIFELPLALKADVVEKVWRKEIKSLEDKKAEIPKTHKKKIAAVNEQIQAWEFRIAKLEEQKSKLVTLLKQRGKYPFTEEQANEIYDWLTDPDNEWRINFAPDPLCEYWQIIGVSVPKSADGFMIDDNRMRAHVTNLVQANNRAVETTVK